jgi:ribosomal protein L37AE/L43A
MVIGGSRIFGCAANFERGRKCVFCGSFKINRTGRGYVKCRRCGHAKSLIRLRKEVVVLPLKSGPT